MDFSPTVESVKLWLNLMEMIEKGMYQAHILLPLSTLK